MIDDYNEDDSFEIKPPNKPTIGELIAVLEVETGTGHVPVALYYGLSNLDDVSLELVRPTWGKLSSDYKIKVATELAEASEADFELDFRTFGHLVLDDSDPDVKIAAINLLWEDESLYLLSLLIDLAENDENTDVRAAATSELGRFILLGEYGDIPDRDCVRAQDVAIGLLNDNTEDIRVRRRALEAISNSSLDFVAEAISEAYESDEQLMRVSALYAMGRSYDQQWSEIVLKEIRSDDPEVRYEAARAAGELEISDAIPLLGQLAVVDEREIQLVAIWSLGEIGGSQATRLLSAMAEDAEEANDEDLLEAIEDALGYASMVGADLDMDFDASDWN